jgi:ubiquinone/menaquinone biosynthesis C-methylase UbiE
MVSMTQGMGQKNSAHPRGFANWLQLCTRWLGHDSVVGMERSAEELAQTARLEDFYMLSRSPVIQNVTDQVYGCGYIGHSYTTRSEADEIIAELGLNADSALLDLGAGAGWPGLYFAKKSGCTVTLLDLPEAGLLIARERAIEDGMASRVKTVQGDATNIPFDAGSFSNITHSDVLCCLLSKKRVLKECRRVILDTGRMAFSVIDAAPNLSKPGRAKALDAGPEFMDSRQPYSSMLSETGWRVVSQTDLTAELELAYTAMINAERSNEAELRRLGGDDYYDDGQTNWVKKLSAVREGLIRRDLYIVAPA